MVGGGGGFALLPPPPPTTQQTEESKMDRDKSIITQVAAKIASELAINNIDIDTYTNMFVQVNGVLQEMIYGPEGESAPVATEATQQVQQVIATVQSQFPSATVQSNVRVKGKQHGPLPEWLVNACIADGVNEVWDNRDGLSENPKRPWFKSTTGNKAYWAPKGAR